VLPVTSTRYVFKPAYLCSKSLPPLGWSSRNELSRIERDTTHSISLTRYLQLLNFYFGHLPETARQDHPGSPLLQDQAIKFVMQNVTTASRMLYEYLAWMHAEVLAGRLMETHPAEQLWQHLNHRGVRAL
jgi:hypothetical protein